MNKFLMRNMGTIASLVVLLAPVVAMSATGLDAGADDAFKGTYEFISHAATGNLGRSIALVGGLISLGIGAAAGKALPAITGIVLGVFGSLGPTIINSIFKTALI
jgi:conjugal transfer pilus assembly protein TraA